MFAICFFGRCKLSWSKNSAIFCIGWKWSSLGILLPLRYKNWKECAISKAKTLFWILCNGCTLWNVMNTLQVYVCKFRGDWFAKASSAALWHFIALYRLKGLRSFPIIKHLCQRITFILSDRSTMSSARGTKISFFSNDAIRRSNANASDAASRGS